MAAAHHTRVFVSYAFTRHYIIITYVTCVHIIIRARTFDTNRDRGHFIIIVGIRFAVTCHRRKYDIIRIPNSTTPTTRLMYYYNTGALVLRRRSDQINNIIMSYDERTQTDDRDGLKLGFFIGRHSAVRNPLGIHYVLTNSNAQIYYISSSIPCSNVYTFSSTRHIYEGWETSGGSCAWFPSLWVECIKNP